MAVGPGEEVRMTSSGSFGRFRRAASGLALLAALSTAGCDSGSLGTPSPGAGGSGPVADGSAGAGGAGGSSIDAGQPSCDVPPPTTFEIPSANPDQTCVFTLPRPVATSSYETLIVSLDHVDGTLLIGQDPTHALGWDYTDATRSAIEVYGNICLAVRSGTVHGVTIQYTCLLI
jgi:hypothetical protein